MSTSNSPQQGQPIRVPDPRRLVEQTRDTALRLYTAVGQQYLTFRRDYFHEPEPTLATPPPQNDVIQQTESGKIADRGLHMMPHAVRDLPLIRELMDHLQWEVDIHTLTARERIALHNLVLVFLYGTDGGIQPWFVEWLNQQMHHIQGVTNPKYYLAFPWHGLLYRTPQELQAFDNVILQENVLEIEREMERYAGQLITVLRDPLHSQPKLAFSGPHAEERRVLFNLKTSAAIALGAYLAVEAVRDLFGAHHEAAAPQSVVAMFPPQSLANILPEENA